jgi:hypothetical protein
MLAGLRAVPVDDSRLAWTLSAAVCTDRRMTAAATVLLDALTRQARARPQAEPVTQRKPEEALPAGLGEATG